jgi:hypothetical protein
MQKRNAERGLRGPWIDPVTMANRFYFHLVSANVRVADRVGIEVREETVMSRSVFKLIRDRWPGTGDIGKWRSWSVEIVNAEEQVVRVVSLDALP